MESLELWTEKYRPHTLDACILPQALKDLFRTYMNDGMLPNLLLAGRAGIGKTSVAMAMLDELGFDYIKINSSLNGNIDTLRNDITRFAQTMSLSGKRKYVIMDEADYLNAQSTQPAFRAFMEQYAKNCGFIFTCNYPKRLLPELHSRLTEVTFKFANPAEKMALAKGYLKRAYEVLDTEGIAYDRKVVAGVVSTNFPDFRKTLNDLHKYSKSGEINSGILAILSAQAFAALVVGLKANDFSTLRKWSIDNSDIGTTVLFRGLYDNLPVTADTIPNLILILAKYQYQAAFAADAEINTMACLTEIISECKFK